MATTVNLRKLMHRKAWEFCTPSPLSPGNGSFVVSDKFNVLPGSSAYFIGGASSIYRYDGDEDAWLQLPNSGIAGTFGAGSCGEFRGLGAMGGVFTQTATAGSTTTITTNRTITRLLAGQRIRVIAGSGIGYDGTILSNTIGANAVITVSVASAVAFDATTQYQVYSGSIWFFNAGSTAVGFSVYDIATNSWTAKSVTGLPTAWGTDGMLVSTTGAAASFASGTATGGTTTTLVNSGKNWNTNQWANYQVRFTGGTGKGQIAKIASNTATTLTISTVAVAPDATTTYSIEGDDDAFYLMGNNAVTLYKYIVSTNTWSTLTPGVARAAAMAAGATANWIDGVSTWVLPSNEAAAAISGTSLYAQNGRYIYSFRGGGSSALDVYDIAANTWFSLSYGNQNETFTTGSANTDFGGSIYILKEATGRVFRFDIGDNILRAFGTNVHPQASTVTGQKIFVLPYVDGETRVNFLYFMQHYRSELLRLLVV